MSASWTARAWKLTVLIGLMAIVGCGPVASPRAAKPAAPPPPPPVVEQPEKAPPPPPELPAGLLAKVNELRRMAKESQTRLESLDLDDLDKLEQQLVGVAKTQELAQEILVEMARLSPEQQAEFQRQFAGDDVLPLLDQRTPAGPAPAALPTGPESPSRG